MYPGTCSAFVQFDLIESSQKNRAYIECPSLLPFTNVEARFYFVSTRAPPRTLIPHPSPPGCTHVQQFSHRVDAYLYSLMADGAHAYNSVVHRGRFQQVACATGFVRFFHAWLSYLSLSMLFLISRSIFSAVTKIIHNRRQREKDRYVCLSIRPEFDHFESINISRTLVQLFFLTIDCYRTTSSRIQNKLCFLCLHTYGFESLISLDPISNVISRLSIKTEFDTVFHVEWLLPCASACTVSLGEDRKEYRYIVVTREIL